MRVLFYILFLLPFLAFGQVRSDQSAFRIGNTYVGVRKGASSISTIRPPVITVPASDELYTTANALSTTNEADATTGLVPIDVTLASIESLPSPQDGASLIEITATDQVSDHFEVNLTLPVGFEYDISYWGWEDATGYGRSTGWTGFNTFDIVNYTTTPTLYSQTITTTTSSQQLKFYNLAGGKVYVDGLSIKRTDETDPPPSGTVPEITLSTLKAFPAAFGAGSDATGGRGGAWIAVTNFNDTGTGSFRAAWDAAGARNIIIQVEGLTEKLTSIKPTNSNRSNVTIYGQMAPGQGLTVSGIYDTTPDLNDADYTGRTSFSNAGNIIIRHMTFQNKDIDCIVNSGCADALNLFEIAAGTSVYLDHLSLRYGADQTYLIVSRFSTIKSTVAYSLMAEAQNEHNTGAIVGDNGSGVSSSGNHTTARNMWADISHRFPNFSGSDGNMENYNNYVSNYETRIMRTDGPVKVDFFHNYVEQGNHAMGSTTPLNKMDGPNEAGFRTYTADNYVTNWDETPSGNQTNIWVDKGTNLPIPGTHYVGTRQFDYGAPADGLWAWNEIKTKVAASVGHNRGINTDGSPGIFRDNRDEDYIDRSLAGTTRATYRPASSWDNPTFPGTSMYAETDGDYMPDWFEDAGFDQPTGGETGLNKNSASDRDQIIVNWDFGDYTVVNTAGYTNFEMCAAYYAGDFETILDGTNDLNITVE